MFFIEGGVEEVPDFELKKMDVIEEEDAVSMGFGSHSERALPLPEAFEKAQTRYESFKIDYF